MTDGDLGADAEIAGRLGRTWQPFFQRFGRLTEVQREAILPILSGKDVLVTSPTASGKTEAVCAPLMERNLSRREGFKLLYVCPTRALVNDLYSRLEGPLRMMNRVAVRQTAEHRHDLRSDPALIITTPESMDSMLCRGRAGEGHAFSGVTAVVLDEIHLLDGTPRGEQLIWLIHRLRRLKKDLHGRGVIRDPSLQVVALSATVPDAAGVTARYLGPSPVLVRVGTQRAIASVACDAPTMSVRDMLEAHIAGGEAADKILVFCNSRRSVDALSGHFAPLGRKHGYLVRAHHGSMARALRERTEEDAQKAKRIIVFATSTLEIGIDIGDIDLVALDGAPPDLQSFLQRIGRGNRRTDVTKVLLCAEEPQDLFVQYAMFQAARDGWFPSTKVGRSYSVISQQMASYIFQSPSRERSRERIETLFSDAGVPRAVMGELLDRMISGEELVARRGKVSLGEFWGKRAEQMGKIHSNIEGGGGLRVVDRATGETLLCGVSEVDGSFHLNGQTARVVSIGEFDAEVLRTAPSGPSGGGVRYFASRGPRGTSTHPVLLRHYLELPDEVWPCVEADGMYYVFHLGGPSMYLFLRLAGSKGWLGADPRDHDEWCMVFDRDPSGSGHDLAYFDPSGLVTEDDLASAENILGRPTYNRRMPDGLRKEELLTWFDPAAEAARFERSAWGPVDGEKVRSVLLNYIHQAAGP